MVQAPATTWDLSTPLVRLSQDDAWTIGNSLEGLHSFGRSGAGKSSSGKIIAESFLKNGYGGLVLTAKIEERQEWENYCANTGRTNQLIIISPQHDRKFNFLNYEFARPGAGAGLTENLVNLFTTVMETAGRSGGGGEGGGGEAYWTQALRQLLSNAIDLVAISKNRVTLPDIYNVINSAPNNPDQLLNQGWQKSSFCYECLMEGDAREDNNDLDSVRLQDWHMTVAYWLEEFPSISDRTRSIIVNMFTGMANSFLRGVLHDLFCTTTNVIPELTHEGAIIVVDLPVKAYRQVGIFTQVLWKYMFQQAAERRNVRENPRPLFLWVDESQFFVNSYDYEFQTTARSSRVATVYLTQNWDNYIAMLGGGPLGEAQTQSLLGNFATLVFHTNAHVKTNTWGSDTIGKTLQLRRGTSANTQMGGDGGGSAGGSTTEVLDYECPPQEFTTLRTGGPANNLEVDAIVFRSGGIFNASGRTWIRTTFKQG